MFSAKLAFKLVDKGLGELKKELRKTAVEKPYVKAGLLGSKASRPGEGLTNPELGIIHEFGTSDGKIPARPFLRPSFEKNKATYKKLLEKLVPEAYRGAFTPELQQALEIIGQKMAADTKAFIVGGESIKPDNAPAVKARKEKLSSGASGGVRTLVDTGRMVGAISHEVVRGKGGG